MVSFAATLAAGDVLYFAHDAGAGTLEVKVNGTTVKTETDLAYFNNPDTNDVGIVLSYDGSLEVLDVFRSFEAGTIATVPPADTTPPTLTLPTVTATGTTTVSGGITTTEAGPAWAILSTSATAPTAAQIKVGQNAGGTASPSSTATLSVGANTAAFLFTGLTPSTGYYLHVVQDDAATPVNTSAPVTATMVTTQAADTTPPTLSAATGTVKSNALIVLGTTTNEANGTLYGVLTTSPTDPTALQVRSGQNQAGSVAAWAGSLAIASSGAKTFNATGLAANTGYYAYFVHRDASGNDSTVQSLGLRTTFRNGATGQWIIDHPGSFMAQCVEAGDEDSWFDWEQVTAPASGAWTEGPYADGTGVFEGPAATTMVILLRKDGATVGNFTVFLYDSTHISATQGGSWTVRNLVSSAQTGGWSIQATGTATASQPGAWSVRNLTTAVAQSGAWSVLNLATATQSGAWGVANVVGATQSGSWTVRNLVGATQGGTWAVQGTSLIVVTQSGAWSVRNMSAVATQAGAWSLEGLVLAVAAQQGAWSVMNLVGASQEGGWSIRSTTRIPSNELRVVRIDADGVGILGVFIMQPGEVLDFGFDFQPWLNDCNDTIASYAVTSTDDMPIMETDRVEGVIVALVDGTVDGASHKLTCSIQTNGGRVKEADIRVRVKEF